MNRMEKEKKEVKQIEENWGKEQYEHGQKKWWWLKT